MKRVGPGWGRDAKAAAPPPAGPPGWRGSLTVAVRAGFYAPLASRGLK
jgi:hypothetical protein